MQWVLVFTGGATSAKIAEAIISAITGRARNRRDAAAKVLEESETNVRIIAELTETASIMSRMVDERGGHPLTSPSTPSVLDYRRYSPKAVDPGKLRVDVAQWRMYCHSLRRQLIGLGADAQSLPSVP